MAASLRSPPPFPAALRRCRAVVRASSSSAVSSAPKARFVAQRSESTSVQQLARPLAEYMSLPASQYSVLDAERIERIDESTFRCYVYRFRFFALEVCPVLLVRVDEEPNGCCISLLSCKLEGSPVVEAQNDKFSASMVNRVFCNSSMKDSTFQQLTSDTTIEVTIDIPFPFQALPVETIESSGRQVLEQLLRVMLPRFLKQLVKDYQAWASGMVSDIESNMCIPPYQRETSFLEFLLSFQPGQHVLSINHEHILSLCIVKWE
ncbi:hypothetical protein GUJ93_ZPchr0013g37595 [Zizania palustris]|uniref:Uncharacterized protein n=1 Tax=Zizania palustris TaxID=103762 RepID=A0A8J5WVN3_ZIZPA|nr:hypothetical protein GUJ93_ZPchr0013g37595 [Zizania palustris]